ncbi:MAG TPA: flavodoxin family protein [Acidobacteriaceae bacterium]|jgi:multimeric flavodoxin WrbA|nr:flavodoxin family protein [Acidobacteriaceae bacterium]
MGKVVAIVGSYHRGGITDQAVDAVLAGAEQGGAKTRKIYLVEQTIEFCRNCRMCTQFPGEARGECVHQDDLELVLREVESASALVLGSPVNYYNVTAIFRRFMERLIGYTYWPWGENLGPVMRVKGRTKKAVLVASSGMPGFLIPFFTGAARALRLTAKMVGAKPVGRVWIGMVGRAPEEKLPARAHARAMRVGRKLAL